MLDSFATRKTEIRDYACEMNKDIERMSTWSQWLWAATPKHNMTCRFYIAI